MVGSGIVFELLARDKETSNDILFLRPEQLPEIFFDIVGVRVRRKSDLYHAVCTEVMEARVEVFAMPRSRSPSPEVGTSGVAKMNAHTQSLYVFVTRVLESYEDSVTAEFNAHQLHRFVSVVLQGYFTGRLCGRTGLDGDCN